MVMGALSGLLRQLRFSGPQTVSRNPLVLLNVPWPLAELRNNSRTGSSREDT